MLLTDKSADFLSIHFFFENVDIFRDNSLLKLSSRLVGNNFKYHFIFFKSQFYVKTEKYQKSPFQIKKEKLTWIQT